MRSVVPPALALDRWQERTHVSLVAVLMTDVRVRGWQVPGFTAHPQVTFRTYVRHGPAEISGCAYSCSDRLGV